MLVFHEKIYVNNSYYMDMGIHAINSKDKLDYHRHHKLEISLIKSGKGIYSIENRNYAVKSGDIFIINNIEKHRLSVKEELVNMVIHFEPKLIWSDPNNLFDSRYLKIFFERNSKFSHRLDRDNEATKKIQLLFKEIESEFKNKKAEYALMIKAKLLNILVLLIRNYNYILDKDEDIFKTNDTQTINMIIDYIDNNINQSIRLNQLAEIAHMNPSYFSSFFKKYNGIAPSQYILQKRIARSIDYLVSTNKTVLEIASETGFNSTSSFNKAFKKVTGTTPSQYRNNKQ